MGADVKISIRTYRQRKCSIVRTRVGIQVGRPFETIVVNEAPVGGNPDGSAFGLEDALYRPSGKLWKGMPAPGFKNGIADIGGIGF